MKLLRALTEAAYAFPSAKEVTFREFKSHAKDLEGIVFLGAGGNIDEWIKGVSSHLHEEGIAASDKPSTYGVMHTS
ncbi:hypothetical protein LCGC14_1396810 [marine sediment metagenome]|uniref:Uncharacterized protein n=1 Tax=marine sediment metagenome TaxID=412755 RepID=A0A0F9MZY3_9ZZZZ